MVIGFDLAAWLQSSKKGMFHGQGETFRFYGISSEGIHEKMIIFRHSHCDQAPNLLLPVVKTGEPEWVYIISLWWYHYFFAAGPDG